jgi:hypothetical protein
MLHLLQGVEEGFLADGEFHGANLATSLSERPKLSKHNGRIRP